MWDWNLVSTTARSAHYHGVNDGAKCPLSQCLGLRPCGLGFALAAHCTLAASWYEFVLYNLYKKIYELYEFVLYNLYNKCTNYMNSYV